MAPVKIDVEIEGNITLKNALTGVQPRSSAASLRLMSVARSRGITDNIT